MDFAHPAMQAMSRRAHTCATAQQARIKGETADREDAELLRWLLDQGVDFIGLRDGGGIDCANHPGGAHAALIDARRDQQQGEHP
ncbi:hypothetical protein [Alicycliphilus denitrificans]|uniref:hypothetical protein n=1 Tax=Alicycliphilus denitrificans TaxID=179636 RepID=UPI000C9F8B48|nr:hypothetical protein [Alicycliphilus denitrificans]